jgi:hypothetical protein
MLTEWMNLSMIGRIFYANRETRATVWQPPAEYLAELKADEEAATTAVAVAAAAAAAVAVAATTSAPTSVANTPSASPSNGSSTNGGAAAAAAAATTDEGAVEELNDEWLKLQDPSTGNYYYANKVTGKTQWTAPPIAGLAQHDYDRVLDSATGRYYYVHKTTMAVQWEVPASWQAVVCTTLLNPWCWIIRHLFFVCDMLSLPKKLPLLQQQRLHLQQQRLRNPQQMVLLLPQHQQTLVQHLQHVQPQRRRLTQLLPLHLHPLQLQQQMPPLHLLQLQHQQHPLLHQRMQLHRHHQ